MARLSRRLLSHVLFSLVVLPVLFALAGWSLVRGKLCAAESWPDIVRRFGFDPAPVWLVPALQALPKRQLTEEEKEVMNRDGAVGVKGVLADENILKLLRQTVGWDKTDPTKDWRLNGVLNALIMYGPLGALTSSSLNGSASAIWNAQVEPRPPKSYRPFPEPVKPWYDPMPGSLMSMSLHNDVGGYAMSLHTGGRFVIPLSSVFVALTDIPHGLAFLAGSHVQNRKLQFNCGGGPVGVDLACVDRLEQACDGARSWDMKAGDVVIFWGETYHWTQYTENARQAISIRFVPADLMYTGRPAAPVYADLYPPACTPIGGSLAHPIVWPPEDSTVAQQRFPATPPCDELFSITGPLRAVRRHLGQPDTEKDCGPIPW